LGTIETPVGIVAGFRKIESCFYPRFSPSRLVVFDLSIVPGLIILHFFGLVNTPKTFFFKALHVLQRESRGFLCIAKQAASRALAPCHQRV
jgi:hypothetical protein